MDNLSEPNVKQTSEPAPAKFRVGWIYVVLIAVAAVAVFSLFRSMNKDVHSSHLFSRKSTMILPDLPPPEKLNVGLLYQYMSLVSGRARMANDYRGVDHTIPCQALYPAPSELKFFNFGCSVEPKATVIVSGLSDEAKTSLLENLATRGKINENGDIVFSNR